MGGCPLAALTTVKNRSSARLASLAPGLALIAVLSAFLSIGLYYNLANPIWEAPDEPAHYAYVLHIVENRTLPIRQVSVGDQFHQPPLYYVLGSLAVGWLDLQDGYPPKANPLFIWREPRLGMEPNAAVHTMDELPPYQGAPLAVHILRFLSLLGCALAVWATWRLARLILPDRPWLAVASAGFTAFVPQFLFVGSTVGNDGLATGLGALTLLTLVELALTVQAGGTPSRWRFVLLGLWIGLGMLSKLTYYGVVLLVPVALTYTLVVGRKRRRRLFAGWALAGAVGLLFSAWWYARNVLVYATGLAFFGQGRLDPRTLRDIPEKPAEVATALGWYPEPLFQSFWLRFGWMNIYPERMLYDAAIVFTCLAGAGLLLYVVIRRLGRPGLPSSARLGLIFCFLGLLLVFAVTTWRFAYTLGNHYPQGRYLYPVQPATALLVVVGLAELVALPATLAHAVGWRRLADSLGRWLSPVLAMAFCATLAYGTVAAVQRYVEPAYATVPIWRDAERAPMSYTLQAEFAGKVALAGYDLPRTQVAAGNALPVDLYWRSLSKMDSDYQCFVHVADETGKPLAQFDAPAGNGVALTSRWESGEVLREQRLVQIGAEVPPGTYQVLVGLYSLADMKRLPLTGQPESTTVRLGEITVLPAGATPAD